LFPRNVCGPENEIPGFDNDEFGLTCSVVGESNDLITHANICHPLADLLHHASEITALA
jgi:hypothetical protein